MKIKRRIQLTFYSIFSIITFHKYYICEGCHKIHKRIGKEFKVCGGWYKPHIFVSNDCANKAINNTRKVLRESLKNNISYCPDACGTSCDECFHE